jgi:hypothetical protein
MFELMGWHFGLRNESFQCLEWLGNSEYHALIDPHCAQVMNSRYLKTCYNPLLGEFVSPGVTTWAKVLLNEICGFKRILPDYVNGIEAKNYNFRIKNGRKYKIIA